MNLSHQMPRDIRAVAIPITSARLLLPNASVAEVIAYGGAEKIEQAPDWLLGRLSWRGWQVPLFSFAVLSGAANSESVHNAKVVVLKTLGGDARLPFVALLTQGFPRLVTVDADLPMHVSGSVFGVRGVRSQVLLRGDHAIIPDLDLIEALIAAIRIG